MSPVGRGRLGASPSASARYERLLYTSEGGAALLYTPILLPGSAGILRQTPQLEPWYGYGLILVTLGLPVMLAMTAWLVSRRVQRVLASITALAFLVAMMLFPLGLPTPTMEDNAAPWFQGIHALHGLVAATAWRHSGIWAYGLAQGVVIGVVQNTVKTDAARASFLGAVSSFVFVIILMAVAQSVVAAAYRLDSAAALARSVAASTAAARTREREESRINAMVHDDIISVLITASRANPPGQLGHQAELALAAIGTLERAEGPVRDYTSTEVVSSVRTVVDRYAPGTPVSVEVEGETLVPADAMTALSDALGEALRNSVRHASRRGEEVPREVKVTIGRDSVRVIARDEGKGFLRRATSSRRLGIRLSILERMAIVEGGAAQVSSRPGAGTTVTLDWRRPS